MPAEFKRIEGEPIVVAALSGHVVADDMETVYKETQTLLENELSHVYRITDVREADSNFGDMIKILMASKNKPGSSSDPRIKVVFVGKNKWVQMARDAFNREQFGAFDTPIFPDMEDAMGYIRRLISESQDESSQAG